MKTIADYFNRACNTYDNHCDLQTTVGKKLITYLQTYINHTGSIIDIGCGTGITTKKLADSILYQQFHAIDLANDLLLKANKRLANYSIRIYQANFDHLTYSPYRFDIIFSNMSLHWSEDLFLTLAQLNQLIHPSGLLIFTIPLDGTFTELNNHFEVNKFYSAKKIITGLTNAGYRIIAQQEETISSTFNTTLETLRSIKLIGANHTIAKKQNSLHGKTFFKKINIQQLSYHIGYFIAKKAY